MQHIRTYGMLSLVILPMGSCPECSRGGLGQALMAPPWRLRGPGHCGPPWAPMGLALVGRALVGHAWVLMGRAIVGPWALMGRALMGSPWASDATLREQIQATPHYLLFSVDHANEKMPYNTM